MTNLSVSQKQQILSTYSEEISNYLLSNLHALNITATGEVAQVSYTSIPDILKFSAFSFGIATGVSSIVATGGLTTPVLLGIGAAFSVAEYGYSSFYSLSQEEQRIYAIQAIEKLLEKKGEETFVTAWLAESFSDEKINIVDQSSNLNPFKSLYRLYQEKFLHLDKSKNRNEFEEGAKNLSKFLVKDFVQIIISNPSWRDMKDKELHNKLGEALDVRLNVKNRDYETYIKQIVEKYNIGFLESAIYSDNIHARLATFNKVLAIVIKYDEEMQSFLLDDPYFKARFAFELHKYSIDNKDKIYHITKKKGKIVDIKLSGDFVCNYNEVKKMFEICKAQTIKLLDLTQELQDRISHGESAKLIESFLSQHEDIDLGWVNAKKENCLFWAAQKNNPEIIKILLAKMQPAELNIRNEEKGYSPLLYALSNNFFEAAKALIDEKTDITLKSTSGASALLMAISAKQDDIAIMILNHPKAAEVVNHSFVSKTAQGIELTRTPLIMAAQQQNVELVKKLLLLGADPTIKIYEGGATALHLICKFADITLINFLMQQTSEKFQFDEKICGIMIGFLIEQASEISDKRSQEYKEKTELIKHLILHPNTKISFVQQGSNLLHQAIYKDMWDIADVIIGAVTQEIKKDAIDLFATDQNGYSIMHLTAEKILHAHMHAENQKLVDLHQRFEHLLAQVKAIDMQDAHGQTVMHMSARLGSFQSCEYFAKKGASLSTQDENGDTPAHIAIKNANFHTFSYIFGSGGSAYNHQNKSGSTIFLDALDALFGARGSGQTHEQNNLLQIISTIYRSSKVDFKIVNNISDSALILAAGCGLTALCKGLIEAHQVTTDANKDGLNALHLACARGKLETAQFLMTKQVFADQINSKVATGDSAGWSALHFAASSTNLELVKFLCDQGADIHSESQEKLTPLFISTYSDDLATFKYLKEKGSNIDQTSDNESTILDSAIKNGAQNIINYAIDELHFDINSKDHFSDYPLLTAARYSSDTEFLKFLINKKHADPFIARTSTGRTVLHELVTLLCLEIEKRSVDHNSQEYLDTINCIKSKIIVLSGIESGNGNKLTEERDATYHNTPLLSTIADFGNLEMTKFLLEKCGADANSTSIATGITNGLNAIGLAMHYKKFDLVEFLLSQENIDLKTQDSVGNNLLQIAAAAGNFDIIRKIIHEHQTEFVQMSSHINSLGQNFLHLVATCTTTSRSERSKFIEEVKDVINAADKALANQIFHCQKDGTFHRSVEEEISENTGLAFLINNLRKSKTKLAEEKHRLGIDKIEEDISVLKTDVAELKTDVAELKTEFREFGSQLNQILGILSDIRDPHYYHRQTELAGVTISHHDSDTE